MENISLEIKLIEDIQRRALSRINDLQKALDEANVLDPTFGKILIDEHLWKTDDGSNRRHTRKTVYKNKEDTVYGSITDELARAVIEWKEENKESPLKNLAIWISYNSRLADPKWQDSERVLSETENRQSASYVCTNLKIEEIRKLRKIEEIGKLGKGIVERKRDLVSVWFELLKDSFSTDGKNDITPSIHYYLSKFDPHFKETDSRIRTVAFFSEESEEEDQAAFGKRHNRQENDILLRNRSSNDLYIRLPWAERVENVAKTIYNKLFEKVVFGSGSDKDDFPHPLTRESAEEWSRRYAVFLRGLILCNETDDLEALAKVEGDEGFRDALYKAINEEKELRKQKEIVGQPYRSMTNIYIKVPGSEGNLGSVIIFSDKIINPALTRIISSSVWAVFSHLREVEESVIAKNTFKKHTSRSAIAAIMGRNMSHNIGSHVLWHLGRDIEKEGKCPGQTAQFLKYLQQRMDFIAQITTSPVSWCQSLNFEQLISTFDNEQTVLKDNIARSYSEEIKLKLDFTGVGNDIEVDIPGGLVGAQALYSILENIIRNAAKHGDREKLENNELRLEIRLEEPNLKSSSSAKFEWAKKFYKLTLVDNLQTTQEDKQKLICSLSETMIDDEGSVKPGSWGMKEIKICASYLRRIGQHNIDLYYDKWQAATDKQHPPIVGVELETKPHDSDSGFLAYSFYLLKTKMAAIVHWQSIESKKNKDKDLEKERFRTVGIDLLDENEFFDEFDKVVLRHDFVVLPIEFYRENIKAHNRQNELPTRIFLVGQAGEKLTESEEESAVLISRADLDGFIDAHYKLKFYLWRKWVEKFFAKYYLYIRWDKDGFADRTAFSYGADGTIAESETASDELNQDLNRSSFVEFVEENVDTGVNNSLVFDHQKWSANSDLCQKAIFQESLDDISPTRNLLHTVSYYLTRLEELNEKQRTHLAQSVFLLKEAAATTVGILDNRIYRQGESKLLEGNKGYGFGKFPNSFTLSETWKKRRVYFLDPKRAKEDFEEFIEEQLLPPLAARDFEKYDFLILHQGDLDEIQSKMKRVEKNFESVWSKLEQKAKHLVIVTGRGMPQIALDRKLHWVGYSALADELLGKSKIELVEMLYSLRATVNTEKL